MLKKLFSHTVIYGLAPQIPKIASFFVLPFITPFLTDVDFGVFGFVMALIGAIEVFSTLGLNVVLGNMYIKSPNHYKWGWRQIYGFLTLWNVPYALILGTILYLSVKYMLGDGVMENISWIILLNVIPVILFGPTLLLGTTFYRYKQKPFQIAIRSITGGLLTIGLNLLFISYMEMGYMGWFISIAIAKVLMQLSYWYPINIVHGIKPILNFKRRFIWDKLKVSIPTVPHYYGGYLLGSSDRLVMGGLGVPLNQVGQYQAANTISNPFQILGTASGQAIGPMLQQSYKDKNEKLTRTLIFTLQVAVLALSFIIAIWAKELFTFLIRNPELQSAYRMSVILIMAYTYRPMYFGANNRLFYYEKTKVLMKVTFIAGGLNVLLNFIFIPVFGFQVVAITTFVCMMYMGYSGYFLKEFRSTNKINFYPIYWLIFTVVLTILAYCLIEIYWVWKSVISVMVLLVALLALKSLNKKSESERIS